MRKERSSLQPALPCMRSPSLAGWSREKASASRDPARLASWRLGGKRGWGRGPICPMAVAVAKALGAQPVILTGTRDNRLKIGLELGADAVVNIRKTPDVVAEVKKLNGGKGVDYVVECSAATSAVNDAVRMVNRGGRVCLAAFAHEEVPVDVAHIVRNNIYVYGIRGEGKSATH